MAGVEPASVDHDFPQKINDDDLQHLGIDEHSSQADFKAAVNRVLRELGKQQTEQSESLLRLYYLLIEIQTLESKRQPSRVPFGVWAWQNLSPVVVDQLMCAEFKIPTANDAPGYDDVQQSKVEEGKERQKKVQKDEQKEIRTATVREKDLAQRANRSLFWSVVYPRAISVYLAKTKQPQDRYVVFGRSNRTRPLRDHQVPPLKLQHLTTAFQEQRRANRVVLHHPDSPQGVYAGQAAPQCRPKRKGRRKSTRLATVTEALAAPVPTVPPAEPTSPAGGGSTLFVSGRPRESESPSVVSIGRRASAESLTSPYDWDLRSALSGSSLQSLSPYPDSYSSTGRCSPESASSLFHPEHPALWPNISGYQTPRSILPDPEGYSWLKGQDNNNRTATSTIMTPSKPASLPARPSPTDDAIHAHTHDSDKENEALSSITSQEPAQVTCTNTMPHEDLDGSMDLDMDLNHSHIANTSMDTKSDGTRSVDDLVGEMITTTTKRSNLRRSNAAVGTSRKRKGEVERDGASYSTPRPPTKKSKVLGADTTDKKGVEAAGFASSPVVDSPRPGDDHENDASSDVPRGALRQRDHTENAAISSHHQYGLLDDTHSLTSPVPTRTLISKTKHKRPASMAATDPPSSSSQQTSLPTSNALHQQAANNNHRRPHSSIPGLKHPRDSPSSPAYIGSARNMPIAINDGPDLSVVSGRAASHAYDHLQEIINSLPQLEPGRWLGDVIINRTLNRLASDKVGIVSSFATAVPDGSRVFRQFPADKEMYLIPECVSNHWRLWCWSPGTKHLDLFDSLGRSSVGNGTEDQDVVVDDVENLPATTGEADRVLRLLRNVYARATRQGDGDCSSPLSLPLPPEIEGVTVRAMPCARQPNTDDCGLWTITFATNLSTGIDAVVSVPNENTDMVSRDEVRRSLLAADMSVLPYLAATVTRTELRGMYCSLLGGQRQACYSPLQRGRSGMFSTAARAHAEQLYRSELALVSQATFAERAQSLHDYHIKQVQEALMASDKARSWVAAVSQLRQCATMISLLEEGEESVTGSASDGLRSSVCLKEDALPRAEHSLKSARERARQSWANCVGLIIIFRRLGAKVSMFSAGSAA
ncbi:hypothetical protein VSDG_09499 [Cytospora chrysosperma]|uniref:Ubiquitin-like protease family profile domain-containing protein n=1 Tax=Cytospora chrysosperma TaxID=252740 RepID=A0A423VD63_CYTCH|nr:hypothetical protein VSDG_09499 [Valsa sordida]